MRLARLLIRRLLAGLFIFMASMMVAIMTLAVIGLPDDSIEKTIAKNHIIEADFKQAAAIDAFRAQTGRHPRADQVERLAGWPKERKYALFVSYGDASMCSDRAGFADAAKDGYIIEAWAGHWMECYAPRSGLTTLHFSREDYAMFGTRRGERVAAVAFVVLLIVLARLLWTGGRIGRAARQVRME